MEDVQAWAINSDWSRQDTFGKKAKNGVAERKLLHRYNKLLTRALHDFEQIGIPATGEQYRLITTRRVNSFALIEYLLAKGRTIEDLNLVVFSSNPTTIKSLTLQADRIKAGQVIISSFEKGMKEKVAWIERLVDFCREQSWPYAYLHSHAKIIILKTDQGEYLTLEGSGNLTNNSTIEQFVFENSREVYEWHRQWISETINASHGEQPVR